MPVLPGKAARWSRREHFHLTLRFLGNVAMSRVDDLVQAARAACDPFGPLRLTAAGVGFFPDSGAPRVLWVGVKDLDERLRALWSALQSATQLFTAERAEKDFTGHVTLARINRLPRTQAAELAKAAAKYDEIVFGRWIARSVELMRSELLPRRAHHSVLAELSLQASA